MKFTPIAFIRKAVTWTCAGAVDRVTSRCSGKRMDFGMKIASKLDECQPWTDHFETSSLHEMHKAIDDKQFNAARLIHAIGAKEAANKHCLDLALLAINMLADGEDITFDLFYCME